MNFAPSVFRPRFNRYLRKHLPKVTLEKQSQIWQAMATDPDRIQKPLEDRFFLDAFGDNTGGLARRQWAISDFFQWLVDNWALVLQILLALLPLILQERAEDESPA